jgi:hypothetical protein
MEMRQVRTIATILMMMLGSAVGLVHGQNGTPGLKLTVPFPFVIQKTTLPPGDYLFFSSHAKLWVQEASGRNVALFLTGVGDGRTAERDGRAIFDCYFGECFLSQVWIAGEDGGRTLPKSKRQVELASKGSGQQFALLGKKPQR